MIRAGTMFGIASLLERSQDEYALALEPSRVGVVGLNDFWHLVRQNPEVNARLVKVLGDRLRQTRGRMADIALKETRSSGQSDPRSGPERGGGDPRRALQAYSPLHPRAVGGHDRSNAGVRDQGVRETARQRLRAAF